MEEYTLFATKLGTCGIAWKESSQARSGLVVMAFQLPEASDRLTAVRLAGGSVGKARRIPPPIAAIIKRVKLHLAGIAQDFRDIVVDFDGAGPFAKTV
jgi:hypothetical protein